MAALQGVDASVFSKLTMPKYLMSSSAVRAHAVSRNLLVALLVLVISGCTRQSVSLPQPEEPAEPVKQLEAAPEITSESEEGYYDLIFYIEEHKQLPDGSQTIRASGKHKGRPLGFELVLGPAWKSGSVTPDIPLVTHQGSITYRSTGADSDAFVQVLDELYDTKLNSKSMRKETPFTAISLEGDPSDLARGIAKIKLFFESDKEDEYAELFTNIHLGARRLEFREKDEEYRSAVVKALRGE